MSKITAAEALGHKKGRSVAKLIAEMTNSYQNVPEGPSKISQKVLPSRNQLPEEWMRENISSGKSSHEYSDFDAQYSNKTTPEHTSHTFGPSDPNSRAWTALKTSSRNRSLSRPEETNDRFKTVKKGNEEVERVSAPCTEYGPSATGDQMLGVKLGKTSPREDQANT
ncbi:hypothetical protein MFRU_007g03350 [Monilinia fructicola]|nr:hypothetical protein MFRU_007g03350 [Monilinia fructicola]